MIENPWWHGYHKQNYVASYIYITQAANQMGYGGTVNAPSGLSPRAKAGIDAGISYLQKSWKKELASGTVNAKAKRDFVWGMATHTLADTFAHSAYVWNKTDRKWIHLVHKKENAYRKDKKYAERSFRDSRRPSSTFQYFYILNVYAYIITYVSRFCLYFLHKKN